MNAEEDRFKIHLKAAISRLFPSVCPHLVQPSLSKNVDLADAKETRRCLLPGLARTGACLLAIWLVATSVAMAQTPVKVNHTLPSFEAPKAGQTLSANPTVQEIFRAHVFEEPLVPVGGQPTEAENADLSAALAGYSARTSVDDCSTLTGFLQSHPQSPWRAALLTDLGLEYYHTAHYSLALDAWEQAWNLAKDATDAQGKAIGDRALGELAAIHARVGHMTELDGLLKSVEGRSFSGPATERVANARGGLADMKERPEISFRCGPLALHQIVLATEPEQAGKATAIIYGSASTQKGFSLHQVAELSEKVGLNYQMAHRDRGAEFIVPSVVHWKVGHYAALIRQQDGRYFVKDPTFQNNVWATKAALEAETSGYFVVPAGKLPTGWTPVEATEGDTVWGKGNVGGPDPAGGGGCPPCTCSGMAVSAVDLLYVSLKLMDNPVGYVPPVGPAIQFTMHYNQRDPAQPSIFSYANFGAKWTLDWIAYITDNPMNTNADVEYYRMGGFKRAFTGFDPTISTFSPQFYDHTLLKRIAPSTYKMQLGNGSILTFSQSDGSSGSSRKVFLTQIADTFGNAANLSYDSSLRLVAVTDAIGQVTVFRYDNPADMYKVTRITDPFGRFATFDYDASLRLVKITDVIGLTSQFIYDPGSDFINALITPYGTTRFAKGENGTTRSLETTYPDGTKDRAEFNENLNLGISEFAPANQVPAGMPTHNDYIYYRNTYFWSRNNYANSYPDYTKAKIYHWLHTPDLTSASGALESTKEPLENRVWYSYDGQSDPIINGYDNQPTHIGRVLDDGTSQIYQDAHDMFGHLTNSIDPAGRSFSYIYATNNIDLIEIRQTRAGSHDLLFKTTYNTKHRPVAVTDAAGQTTTYGYNSSGQLIQEVNPKGETATCTYDGNGYLVSSDGPLSGTGDTTTLTYDSYGRVRTLTDGSGYTLTFDYDNMDRITKVTHPDATFEQYTYDRLSPVIIRDRAGRQTLLEYNNMRQLVKKTDPQNRVTRFEWCQCGSMRSMTDPMGRMTSWITDLQGRRITKHYGDGSEIHYLYENTTSRLRQVIDEKQQAASYTYAPDNLLKSIVYGNAAVPTPPLSYTYDPNYRRVASMTDGSGTTVYSYVPISVPPLPGATSLASVDGPLANDTVTYGYDVVGRLISRSINGVPAVMTYDAAKRIVSTTNALGSFGLGYAGVSARLTSQSFPNGQTETVTYGSNLQDFKLQSVSYAVGATPVSQFLYSRDVPRKRINSWSQQAGAQPPSVYSFLYDNANQLLSAFVTNNGALVNTFGYSYDPAGNRLTEQVGAANYTATHNALNQITTTTAPGSLRTNEWDAANRLVAVNAGNQRTEFTYDGLNRMVGIRQLVNGSEVSHRLLVWDGSQIVEERNTNGVVTKRFFAQGVRVETGTNAGNYYYTRDHLRSVQALTDSSGNVRARYAYDPFGRRTKVSGDQDADFGYAGMFWAAEAGLAITHFRAYDPGLGRWLSRDPLKNAELSQGPNLYAYVGNDPISRRDSLGLAFTTVDAWCEQHPIECAQLASAVGAGGGAAATQFEETLPGWAPFAANAAPCLAQAAPEFESINVEILAEDVPELPAITERIADLGSRFQLPSLQADLSAAAELDYYTPAMDELDVDFYDLANELAQIGNISLADAWQRLAAAVNFDPKTWPQLLQGGQ